MCHFLVKNISNQNFFPSFIHSIHLPFILFFLHSMYNNSIYIIITKDVSFFPLSSSLFSFPFFFSVRPSILLLDFSGRLFCPLVGRSVCQSICLPTYLPFFLPSFIPSPFISLFFSLSLLLSPFLFLTRCTSVVCFFVVCFSEFDSSTRSPVLVRACIR